MKKIMLYKVLPLFVVALVGVSLSTSCEKEKESTQTPPIVERSEIWECVDSLYSIRVTMYPDALKFFTEVEDNRSEALRQIQQLMFWNNCWYSFCNDTIRHSGFGYPQEDPILEIMKVYQTNSIDTMYFGDGSYPFQVTKDTFDSISLKYIGMVQWDGVPPILLYDFKKLSQN